MADKKIDEVAHDDAIGGSEKFPLDDAGVAKYATTGDVKQYVIDQIEALTAASAIDTSTDSLYLLKSGELKPISALTVAQAVLDYGFGLAGISSVTGNELITLKDDDTKKTVTAQQLKTFINNNVAIPWADLTETDYDNSGAIDLADNDYLVFRDTSASGDKKIKISSYRRYQQEAFKAYVKSLSSITGSDYVRGTDLVYLVHTDGSGNESAIKATVSQLLAAAGITNAVTGPESTTENKIPQWDSSTRVLKDGLTVTTSVSASDASDTKVPTESAVRNAISSISMTDVVHTTNDETIGGTKTFSLFPVLPNSSPTSSRQAATKAYVDAKLNGSFVNITDDQDVGGTKTFVSSPIVPMPTSEYHAVTKNYVDSYFVDNTSTESIGGVKTFTSSPIVPTPTTDMQAATKKYVDDNAVKLTGDQTIAGAKTFSGSVIAAGATTVTVPTVSGTTDSTTKAASTAFVQAVVEAIDHRFKFANKTFENGVITLDDRSLNAFTLPYSDGTTTYTVNMPTSDSETHSRCFGIVLATSTGTGTLELNLATGSTYYAEASDTFNITAGSYNLIMFRELKSTNEFLVSRRTLSTTGTKFSVPSAS